MTDHEEHREVRVGVIGCGAGVFHLDGYTADPRARIVALAGLDADRCGALAKRYEIPRVFRDYEDLLAEQDIDAVSIAVPNNLHATVAIAALEAGKHVLIEKPLARHAEEGERMVAAAEQAGKILAIAFQRRTRHDVEIMREEVAAGRFGNVYYAKAWWMRRQGIPGWGSWFTSRDAAGGGPLIDLGVHVVDMALYAMGSPRVTAVSAATYAEIGPRGKGNFANNSFRREVRADTGYEVEDLATAFLRLENGATLLLEASWASFTEMNDAFGIQLYGSLGGGRIHSEGYADRETLTLFHEVGDTTSDSRPHLQSRPGHARIIAGFLDGILDGKPVSPDGREGLERVRLIDAVYKSAELGREITL